MEAQQPKKHSRSSLRVALSIRSERFPAGGGTALRALRRALCAQGWLLVRVYDISIKGTHTRHAQRASDADRPRSGHAITHGGHKNPTCCGQAHAWDATGQRPKRAQQPAQSTTDCPAPLGYPPARGKCPPAAAAAASGRPTVSAAGRPTGCTPIEATGDANPAATACTDGGGGRPQRRRGPAHGLRRQPGEEVGARAARVCQMRRERTNGEQARGEEENGLVVSKERARRGPSVAYESRS